MKPAYIKIIDKILAGITWLVSGVLIVSILNIAGMCLFHYGDKDLMAISLLGVTPSMMVAIVATSIRIVIYEKDKNIPK